MAMGKSKEKDEIKDILLSYKYIQIGPYNGAREPIKCFDSDGYIVYPVLYRLYKGKKPLRFHRSNPDTIQNIKHYIDINHINVELCSDVFVDAKTKLWFRCACGDLYETTLDNFINNAKYRCNSCALHDNNYVSYQEIVHVLSKKDLIPLFSEKDYVGVRNTKLPVINSVGYKAPFSFKYYYQENVEPAWFHVSNPYTIDNINLYLFNETNGEYECISDAYLGNKIPLVILHKKCN